MLKAKLDDFFLNFFLNKNEIIKLYEKHNGPLNLLYLENFKKNIDNFKNILENNEIRYEIFYAHKSNKSKSFLECAKSENIGIDVASMNELKKALEIGFNTKNIEATGPKSKEFLKLCLENNILINIDSFSELESIKNIKKEMNIFSKTYILVRLSGFKNSKISRFGIEISKIQELINYLEENQEFFKLEGFSLHIDTVSYEEKSKAIEEIFYIYEMFTKKGIYLRKINIGGGFRLSYLEDKDSWEKYLELLKKELIDEKLTMSWKKSSYSFREIGGKVIGEGNIYNPFSNVTKEIFLKQILDYKLKNFGNLTIGGYLKDNLIKLQIEPGRALHDLTGCTICEVISVKEISGEIIVILNINSFSLGSKEQELFVDPIIISKNEDVKTKDGIFFAGNLCLESDFVYRHKSFLGIIPQVGDLVIFPNTAGYFMDFYETTSIGQEVAKKLLI